MARIEIFNYHCVLESTYGAWNLLRESRRRNRSDEVSFFLAALPVDTQGSTTWTDWVYENPPDPELRQKRIRSNFDVDSGDDHGWQHSIAFELEPRPDIVYELILQIYEIDGATATSKQARTIHDKLWAHIEDRMRPGIRIGASPNSLGQSGPSSYEAAFTWFGHGMNDDLMFADVWHFDPARPLVDFDVPAIRGGSDPDLAIAEQRASRQIGSEISRFPPRPARVIERREYRNEQFDAIYRFDVHYSA